VSVLLDTHVWVWTFLDSSRLSVAALDAIEGSDSVVVSAASFFEIAQKARVGKWPEITPHLGDLVGLLERQGGHTAGLSATQMLLAGTLDWDHRDPFDRMIAAAALDLGLPLVSRDTAFAAIGSLTVIW